MKDTYSPTYWKPLAYLDQDTSSWKTFEDISVSDSKKFLKALPTSGMMQGGKLFELVTSERHIKEQDCSLLPTPLATDAKISYVARNQVSLSTVLLPTPTVSHVRNHDEPIEDYQQRVRDYETGRTKGKPGASTGVAVRWRNKNYRIHWMILED